MVLVVLCLLFLRQALRVALLQVHTNNHQLNRVYLQTTPLKQQACDAKQPPYLLDTVWCVLGCRPLAAAMLLVGSSPPTPQFSASSEQGLLVGCEHRDHQAVAEMNDGSKNPQCDLFAALAAALVRSLKRPLDWQSGLRRVRWSREAAMEDTKSQGRPVGDQTGGRKRGRCGEII